MAADDIVKEIRGNQVAFQDCFTANLLFLLTIPWLIMPESAGFLPVSSPPGSMLMADWDACDLSIIILVADIETYVTSNLFRNWTKIRVPPGILTDAERKGVSSVSVTQDGVFFLINGILFLKNRTTFMRLGSKEMLPDGGIIGITTRKWCWIKYLSKANRRSNMVIWTRDEVYLGYTSLKFVKIVNTKKLTGILNIPSAATLTILSVDYTAHPLEFGLFLNYCVTCNVMKQIHLVIYNEDTEQWMQKDFALNVTVDSFLTPRFLYSAIPDFILWDKHRIYYCYNNFTNTGVLQTPTEFGNLSKLSNDSLIHKVFLDYNGNVLVKMENNIMFYFKIYISDAVKLHSWRNSATKAFSFLTPSGQVKYIYVLKNGTISVEEYPLRLEVGSITSQTNIKCPFVTFHTNLYYVSYILDKGESLSFWSQLVYPENNGLYIIMELYGPKLLKEKDHIRYEVASGYCTKTMIITFFQNVNYEAVDDYFKLQYQNTGSLFVQIRPSEFAKTCPIASKIFNIAVGCDTSKFIVVKGFNNKECLQHDFYYIIEKSYLRNRPSDNLRVKYNWKKYGCPLRLDFRQQFHPLLQLYNENGFVEDVEVNFIVWEIHGRDDYSFNNTMKTSGCLHEAQTWKSMTKLNNHLPLEEVWGPENYVHCFSYAIGRAGDLNQPYEIINKSNHNHLVWPMFRTGMYVFRVKILDPNYSFCNLSAFFAIETYGVIPSPNGYLVFSFLFLLMLLFFSILVFSYFHYTRIYRLHIYEPLKKTKDN